MVDIVRYVMVDNTVWVALNDVSDIMGYSKIYKLGARDICSVEFLTSSVFDLGVVDEWIAKYPLKGKENLASISQMNLINLEGMLGLLLMSRKTRKSSVAKNLISRISSTLDGRLMDLFEMLEGMDIESLQPDQFIYVAREAQSGRYKIGISIHPEERIKQLNTGNPEVLLLISVFKAEEGYLTERKIHNKLQNSKIRGEWFSGITFDSGVL